MFDYQQAISTGESHHETCLQNASNATLKSIRSLT